MHYRFICRTMVVLLCMLVSPGFAGDGAGAIADEDGSPPKSREFQFDYGA
ncbi:MAG: hypothetical protein MK171_03260 [Pirellulales bacterium]|nr:hypothetical protein [Pirellulales bacterium]